MVNMGQGNGAGNVDASIVIFLEDDIRRLLIDANTESLEFSLDDALIRQGFVDIKNDENEMTGFRNGDDLAASTFSVFGPLNDTGKI